MNLHSYLFYLSFYLLYFVLPPFKDNGLPFWVPGVLHQCSEVVLWYLLSIQMIFWWICGEESGLPILLLHQLRATPTLYLCKRLIFWNLVSVPHIHSHTDFNINFGKLKFDLITSCAKMNNDSPEFSDKNPNSLVWHYCCSVVAKLCLILWQPHGL